MFKDSVSYWWCFSRHVSFTICLCSLSKLDSYFSGCAKICWFILLCSLKSLIIPMSCCTVFWCCFLSFIVHILYKYTNKAYGNSFIFLRIND